MAGRTAVERLLQACLRDTEVPSEFDFMNVCPGWKEKGSPLDMGRYRFFGLLEPLGKVLDRLVARRMGRLVAPLLRSSFCGFRSGTGAPEGIAFLRRLQEIYNYLLQYDLYAVSLDLKQAFDRFKRAAIIFAVRVVFFFSGKLGSLLIRMLWARVTVLGVKGAPSSDPFDLIAGGKTGAPSTPVCFLLVISWTFAALDTYESLFANIQGLAREESLLPARDLDYADDIQLLGLFRSLFDTRLAGVRVIFPPLGLYLELPKSQSWIATKQTKITTGTSAWSRFNRNAKPLSFEEEHFKEVELLRVLGGHFARKVGLDADLRIRGKIMWDSYRLLKRIVKGAGFGRHRFLDLAESCCGQAYYYNFETHASTPKEDTRIDAQQKRLHRCILGLPLPWKVGSQRESATGIRLNRGIQKWSHRVRCKRIALACRMLARTPTHPFYQVLVSAPGALRGRALKSLPGPRERRIGWLAQVGRDAWISFKDLPEEIRKRIPARQNMSHRLSPTQIILERECEAASAGLENRFYHKVRRDLNRLRALDPWPSFL